jgi:hypothetical protein
MKPNFEEIQLTVSIAVGVLISIESRLKAEDRVLPKTVMRRVKLVIRYVDQVVISTLKDRKDLESNKAESTMV